MILIATVDDHSFFNAVWLPVWGVLAVLCWIGALVWYLTQPDRQDSGFHALALSILGPMFTYFWPLILGVGVTIGFIYCLHRLRLRLYPRLKIPGTDLRTEHPMDVEVDS